MLLHTISTETELFHSFELFTGGLVTKPSCIFQLYRLLLSLVIRSRRQVRRHPVWNGGTSRDVSHCLNGKGLLSQKIWHLQLKISKEIISWDKTLLAHFIIITVITFTVVLCVQLCLSCACLFPLLSSLYLFREFLILWLEFDFPLSPLKIQLLFTSD